MKAEKLFRKIARCYANKIIGLNLENKVMGKNNLVLETKITIDNKISLLEDYKAKLFLWRKNHDRNIRSLINQSTELVRREVVEARCFRTLTIGPPPAIGGLIMENVDAFESMFNPPYLMDLIEVVIDMIDKTIGVLKTRKTVMDITSKDVKKISQEEEKFLQEDFKNIEVKIKDLDQANFEVINQRINEIEKCLQNEISLGVIFLVGSTLEGILFELSKENASEFSSATSAPKNKKGQSISLNSWTLSSLIDVAYELKYLGLNTKKFSHDLRYFRNFIHPREQAKHNFNPDKHSARICFQVLKSAIDDIQKKNLIIPKV